MTVSIICLLLLAAGISAGLADRPRVVVDVTAAWQHRRYLRPTGKPRAWRLR